MMPATERLWQRFRDAAHAARAQPRWFLLTCLAGAAQLAALGWLKANSGNVVDTFFRELPERAAASPAPARLPLCLDFTDPEGAAPGIFGFGAVETWNIPGRWVIDEAAGLSVLLPEGSDGVAIEIEATALLHPNRPRVPYSLRANGDLLEEGALDAAAPRLAKRFVAAARADRNGQARFVFTIRTPGVQSLSSLGIAAGPAWRKLGLSVQRLRITSADGPLCDEKTPSAGASP